MRDPPAPGRCPVVYYPGAISARALGSAGEPGHARPTGSHELTPKYFRSIQAHAGGDIEAVRGGGRAVIEFTVYGEPRPQGNMKAVTDGSGTSRLIYKNEKALKSWRQEIAETAMLARVVPYDRDTPLVIE